MASISIFDLGTDAQAQPDSGLSQFEQGPAQSGPRDQPPQQVPQMQQPMPQGPTSYGEPVSPTTNELDDYMNGLNDTSKMFNEHLPYVDQYLQKPEAGIKNPVSGLSDADRFQAAHDRDLAAQKAVQQAYGAGLDKTDPRAWKATLDGAAQARGDLTDTMTELADNGKNYAAKTVEAAKQNAKDLVLYQLPSGEDAVNYHGTIMPAPEAPRNSTLGTMRRFNPDKGRWEFRLPDGEVIDSKGNGSPSDMAPGPVALADPAADVTKWHDAVLPLDIASRETGKIDAANARRDVEGTPTLDDSLKSQYDQYLHAQTGANALEPGQKSNPNLAIDPDTLARYRGTPLPDAKGDWVKTPDGQFQLFYPASKPLSDEEKIQLYHKLAKYNAAVNVANVGAVSRAEQSTPLSDPQSQASSEAQLAPIQKQQAEAYASSQGALGAGLDAARTAGIAMVPGGNLIRGAAANIEGMPIEQVRQAQDVTEKQLAEAARAEHPVATFAGRMAPVVAASLLNPAVGATAFGVEGAQGAIEQGNAEGWTPSQTLTIAFERGIVNAVLGSLPGGKALAGIKGAAMTAAEAEFVQINQAVIESKLKQLIGIQDPGEWKTLKAAATNGEGWAMSALFGGIHLLHSGLSGQPIDQPLLDTEGHRQLAKRITEYENGLGAKDDARGAAIIRGAERTPVLDETKRTPVPTLDENLKTVMARDAKAPPQTPPTPPETPPTVAGKPTPPETGPTSARPANAAQREMRNADFAAEDAAARQKAQASLPMTPERLAKSNAESDAAIAEVDRMAAADAKLRADAEAAVPAKPVEVNKGQGYDVSDPTFKKFSADVPQDYAADWTKTADGETSIVKGKASTWEVTKGTDDVGRPIVTHVQEVQSPAFPSKFTKDQSVSWGSERGHVWGDAGKRAVQVIDSKGKIQWVLRDKLAPITADTLGLKPGDAVKTTAGQGDFTFVRQEPNGRFLLLDKSTGRQMNADPHRVEKSAAPAVAETVAPPAVGASEASPAGGESTKAAELTQPAPKAARADSTAIDQIRAQEKDRMDREYKVAVAKAGDSLVYRGKASIVSGQPREESGLGGLKIGDPVRVVETNVMAGGTNARIMVGPNGERFTVKTYQNPEFDVPSKKESSPVAKATPEVATIPPVKETPNVPSEPAKPVEATAPAKPDGGDQADQRRAGGPEAGKGGVQQDAGPSGPDARRRGAVAGIRKGISAYKGVKLHDDGTAIHVEMPDKTRLPYHLHDRITPEGDYLRRYLDSAIAANGGKREFTARDGTTGKLPEDEAGWNALSEKARAKILDNFEIHGYHGSDGSIHSTYRVATDPTIASEEVFHASTKMLKAADRPTYERMMKRYDNEDAAFHAFNEGMSRTQYFDRIRKGTAHEKPGFHYADRPLTPRQQDENMILQAAQDAGVLMSDAEFEQFGEGNGLHPDVLVDYRKTDPKTGKPVLKPGVTVPPGESPHWSDYQLTAEGNKLAKFVDEGESTRMEEDLGPARAATNQQRIIDEVLMSKKDKIELAAAHFNNDQAPPEERDAARRILGEEAAAELHPEDDGPIPFAVRRSETGAQAGEETYFKGDLARYTGVTKTIHGGQFDEIVMLEGPDKGETKVIPTKADKQASVEQKQQDWKQQQEEFARLNDEPTQPINTDLFGNRTGAKTVGGGISGKAGSLFGDMTEGPRSELEKPEAKSPEDAKIAKKFSEGEAATGRLFAVRKKADAVKVDAQDRDLVSLHNLTGEHIKGADKLGGIPLPSIAITRTGIPFSQYGEITLIGDRKMVDPANPENQVHDADIYSQRMPRQQFRVNQKGLKSVQQELMKDPVFQKYSKVGDYSASAHYLNDWMEERHGIEDAVSNAKRSVPFMAKYLADHGVEPSQIPMKDKGPTRNSPLNILAESPLMQDVSKKWSPVIRDYESEKISGEELDAKKTAELENDLRPVAEDMVKRMFPDSPDEQKLYLDELKGAVENSNIWDLQHTLEYSDSKVAGEKVRDDYKLQDTLEKQIDENGGKEKFGKWVENLLEPTRGAAYFENRRGTKKPWFLDEIVSEMKRRNSTGQEKGMTTGLGFARAYGSTKFYSVENMRDAKGNLAPDEQVKAYREETQKLFFPAVDAVSRGWPYGDGVGSQWDKLDAAGEAVGRYLRMGGKTEGQARTALGASGFSKAGTISSDGIEKFMELAKKVGDAPVDYFEAKPQRAVKLSDFRAAVVPKDASPEVLDILKKNGLDVQNYEGNNADSRRAAVEQAAKAQDTPKDPVLFAVRRNMEPKSPPQRDTTGIKNEISIEDRKRLNLEDLTEPETRSFEEMYANGKALQKTDPTATDRLMNQLRADPERIAGSKEEAGMLLAKKVDQEVELQRLRKVKSDAEASGDKAAAQVADVQLAAHRQAIKEFTDLTKRTGTATGRALVARKMMSAMDYSLSHMEAEAEAAKGSGLTSEELKGIAKTHDELKKQNVLLQKSLDMERDLRANAEADAAIARMKVQVMSPADRKLASVPSDKTMRQKIGSWLEDAANKARERRKQRLEDQIAGKRQQSGPDPEELADLAIIGADYIFKGADKFTDWSKKMIEAVGETIRPHLQKVFVESHKLIIKQNIENDQPADTLGKMKARAAKGENPEDMQAYIQRLALELVQSGIDKREPLLDALHEKVKGAFPDITREETRDIMSGYGDFKLLNKDKDLTTLRDIKQQSQKVAQLEALQRGELPKATGIERQAPSDETRALTKQVNEKKAELGIEATDPETQLKSALDSMKTRARNTIKDLQDEIDTGQRIVAGKPRQLTDPELEQMRAQIVDLRKQHAAIFTKPDMTDEQRLSLATKAAERNLANWTQYRDDAMAGKFKTKANKRAVTGPELDAINAKVALAKAEYKQLAQLANPPETTSEKQAKQIQKSIDALNERIAAGDIRPKNRARQGPDTQQVAALKTQRDALNKQLSDLRESDPTLRSQKQIDAAEASLAEFRRKQAAGEFVPSKTAPQAVPDDVALAQEQRDAAREEYQKARQADPAYQQYREQAANEATRVRLAKQEADLLDRMAKNDYEPKPAKPKMTMSRDVLEARARVEKAKADFAERLKKYEMAKRKPAEKALDYLAKWVRVGALSWPTVFGKLSGAAVIRTFSTLVETAVGYGLSKVFPRLAKMAPREGIPTITGAMRAEAKAQVRMWTDGIKGAGKMLLNKKTDLQLLHDKHKMPNELMDYFGSLHGAMKNPTFENEYARSLELRTAHAMANGVDTTDPMVQLRLSNEAYFDGKRSIFMQDNRVTQAYNNALSALEAPNTKTGKVSLGLKMIATAGRVELPIVKVPTNVIAEANDVMTGWLTGPARAAYEYTKGIENLKPDEADTIMRLMKKGSIGAAILALGFFKAQNFGGFYQKGDKRDAKDVQPGDINVAGQNVPKLLLHNPYFEVLQFGATIARAAMSRFKKTDPEPKGFKSGLFAATTGLIEEIPFIKETTTIGEYLDPARQEDMIGKKIASVLVPGVVQWAAKALDDGSKRKPEGVVESIKANIPGLREQVPAVDQTLATKPPVDDKKYELARNLAAGVPGTQEAIDKLPPKDGDEVRRIAREGPLYGVPLNSAVSDFDRMNESDKAKYGAPLAARVANSQLDRPSQDKILQTHGLPVPKDLAVDREYEDLAKLRKAGTDATAAIKAGDAKGRDAAFAVQKELSARGVKWNPDRFKMLQEYRSLRGIAEDLAYGMSPKETQAKVQALPIPLQQRVKMMAAQMK